MVYRIGDISHIHVFNWFKDSERDVRTLMMIQVVGSYQLSEIQKQFQKKKNVGHRPSNDPYIKGTLNGQ